MPVKETEKLLTYHDDEFRAFTKEKHGPVRIIGAGLDTSEACTLACPHCYRQEAGLTNGYILPEVASKIMHNLKESNVSEIYFLGAEPTQNPELPKILREAVGLKFKFILLISNGLKLADKNYARQVLLPGVSLLMQRHTLENNALAERIQSASVGKPGTLEQSHAAWRNAQRIFQGKGRDDKLMMQCCLTEAVISNGNLDEVFRWAREELGTLPIMEYISPPHYSQEAQLGWLATYPLLTSQIVAQMERFMKIDANLGLQVPKYKDAVSPQAYNTSCTMLCEGGQITNEGVYLPCTNMGPRSIHPMRYGNILLEPFESIEQSPIRKALLEPNFRIKGCNDPCQGSGCWWTGLVTTGCYRLCQLNCILNEKKQTIDDIPELCEDCHLNPLRKEGVLNCGPKTRVGLALGEKEKTLFKF